MHRRGLGSMPDSWGHFSGEKSELLARLMCSTPIKLEQRRLDGDFAEPAGRDIVDEPAHTSFVWNERACPDAGD